MVAAANMVEIAALVGDTTRATMLAGLQRDWFARERDGRALRLTPAGAAGLRETFGVELGGNDRGPETAAAVPAPKLLPV